jgi:hypothetical protein
MVVKKVLFSLLVLTSLFWVPVNVVAQDDPPEDPAIEDIETAVAEDNRYTAEEFDSLSGDDKRDVYYNSPQLLPDNFQPAEYWHVLYPDHHS